MCFFVLPEIYWQLESSLCVGKKETNIICQHIICGKKCYDISMERFLLPTKIFSLIEIVSAHRNKMWVEMKVLLMRQCSWVKILFCQHTFCRQKCIFCLWIYFAWTFLPITSIMWVEENSIGFHHDACSCKTCVDRLYPRFS